MYARTLPTLAAFAAALALVPAAAQAADVETALVSRASGFAGAAGNGTSIDPSVTQDGRLVAFSSHADNLSDADDDAVGDIFVRDRATGATELISRGMGGVPANDDSRTARISSDGRYVAYVSEATNIAASDANGTDASIFRYDRQTGTTIQVDVTNAEEGSDDESDHVSISGDGARVAFSSFGDNLSAGDQGGTMDVYVRDVTGGATELVSEQGGVGADGLSWRAEISDGGGHVAFESGASNLEGGGAPGTFDVYVRNLATDTVTLASRADGFGGVPGTEHSSRPAISANGRYVAFESAAPNLVDDDDNAAADRIVRRDLLTGSTILVSRSDGMNGTPNGGEAFGASISDDGSRVAFLADLMVEPAADQSLPHAYVRHITGGTTTLISRATGPAGVGADVNSNTAKISGDGQTVAFGSPADNLSAEDGPGSDIFVRGLPIPPIVAPQPQPQPQPQPEPEVPVAQPEPPAQPAADEPVIVVEPSGTGVVAPKLRMKLVRLTAKKAKVRVTCLAGDCRGVLRLKRPKGQGGRRLGKAPFAVTAGSTKKVTVKLRRPAARKVVARATVRPSGASKTVVSRKLRLQRR